MSHPDRYIGLMSGTSLDGVDAVLATFEESAQIQVIHHVHLDMPGELRALCLSLNHPDVDELDRAYRASNQLAAWYASAVKQLLSEGQCSPTDVKAIGVHGQTIRHQPDGKEGVAHSRYTVQLNNPAMLAEWTHIDVIANFRERDVAAGGQGAPLVPAFHQRCFSRAGHDVAVVNIGGIANVTWLDADESCLGWDSGPGNMLLDAWCMRHTGRPWDVGGAWAATGQVNLALLSQWLSDPYFHRRGVKSSGRDYFGEHWLAPALAGMALAPEDVQATLAALTARSIVESFPRPPHQILVCGGGALNHHLMDTLHKLSLSTPVQTTDSVGLPAMQVEAAAFAWLAWAHIHRKPGNLPSATGATGPRILGALYPA